MSVIIVTHIFEVVVHVLRSINLIKFSLSICNSKLISFSIINMFSEVGRDYWSISVAVVCCENVLVEEGASNKGECSPADSHLGETGYSYDCLETEPETTEPSEGFISLESLVQSI